MPLRSLPPGRVAATGAAGTAAVREVVRKAEEIEALRVRGAVAGRSVAWAAVGEPVTTGLLGLGL